jgi:hypothetical protein
VLRWLWLQDLDRGLGSNANAGECKSGQNWLSAERNTFALLYERMQEGYALFIIIIATNSFVIVQRRLPNVPQLKNYAVMIYAVGVSGPGYDRCDDLRSQPRI